MKQWWMAVAAVLAAPVAAESIDISRPATRVEVVASNLNHPWSLAFLPDGDVLVTERNGGLRRISGGQVTRISGVPPVYEAGQGGLFDVVLHPDFEANGTLFLSYAHGNKAANGTRVARARLDGDRLADVTVIYTATPLKKGPVHFGGRMAFLPDGTLLLTTGDGFDFREHAQKKDSPLGKTMRITVDGQVPADNPFASDAKAQPAIFTLGHRNPQGLVHDPVRGVIFSHEHGPKGGDEVNILTPGANYGWPVATHGMDYSGATISPYTQYRGMTQPVLHWTPSIAPSGMAVYRGAMFPEWDGDLLVGALVNKAVRHVRLSADGRSVEGQDWLFREVGTRIRDVRVAPDGSVWLTTDDPAGQVLRVTRR